MSDLTVDEYDYVYNDNNKASQFETSIDRYDEVMQRHKSNAAFKEYLAKNVKPLTNKEIQMFTGFSKMITDAKHNKEINKMDNTMNKKIEVGDIKQDAHIEVKTPKVKTLKLMGYSMDGLRDQIVDAFNGVYDNIVDLNTNDVSLKLNINELGALINTLCNTFDDECPTYNLMDACYIKRFDK